ncbi:MAG: hypothetical protein QF609_10705 [Gammaproteobacteria bacterium]|nr:hypothetical protein [Gammaproteobacteria bacterium]
MPARVVLFLALIMLGVLSANSVAAGSEPETAIADRYVVCSAYFFMAARVKAVGEFDGYFSAGEYAFNQAVRLIGKRTALDLFNAASTEINELIERRWVDFAKADDRYDVVCADIFRDASSPDR